MKAGRLLKLARFLEGLPPRKFKFSSVVAEATQDGCGSVCCAIGWTPKLFPELVEWVVDFDKTVLIRSKKTRLMDYETIAMEIFEIPEEDAIALFTPNYSLRAEEAGGLRDDATPKQVAARIRKYVRDNRPKTRRKRKKLTAEGKKR